MADLSRHAKYMKIDVFAMWPNIYSNLMKIQFERKQGVFYDKLSIYFAHKTCLCLFIMLRLSQTYFVIQEFVWNYHIIKL